MEEVCKYLIPFSGPFKREFSIMYFKGGPGLSESMKPGYIGVMNDGQEITERYNTPEETEQALLKAVMERGIKEIHDLAKGISETSRTIEEMQEKGLASFLVHLKDK
jgi:hypothetical protein